MPCTATDTARKPLSTTTSDIAVQIPQLRAGSFFPSLLERRRRINKALHAVIMEAYVHGVSTRSVDDLVAAMGVETGVSKSEVSRICDVGLDKEINAFRTRSLAYTGFPYVFARCDVLQGPLSLCHRITLTRSERGANRCHLRHSCRGS